jgi:hypothetical protein
MLAGARSQLWTTIAAVAAAVATVTAIDVQVDFDKTFDFDAVRTWNWNPDGRGHVRMARTQLDDPEAVQREAEPLIVTAVAEELGKRGLQHAPGTADVTVTYFLLLSTNLSAQTVGQFVPSTTEWALPPLTRSTQSLKLMNRGSLVLDATAAGTVVWRGVADANIKVHADAPQREALLREAIRDLVRRFPRRRG